MFSLLSTANSQLITLDQDIRAIKRAIVFSHGKLGVSTHAVINDVRCEVCRQAGLIYKHDGELKMLVCRRVYLGLVDLMDRLERQRWKDGYIVDMPAAMPLSVRVGGVPVESLPCEANLMLRLRMRHCWFPIS